jgi:hypothetical protein
MNIDTWENEYRPVDNTRDEYASWDGQLFETYGKDEETVITVARQTPRRVWTLVDTDDGLVVTNGFHYVNRVGYFITEKEWENGATIDIAVSDSDAFHVGGNK